jgi:hypothetical protein
MCTAVRISGPRLSGPDIATSQALEELSIELMDKAAELDQLVGNDLGLRV